MTILKTCTCCCKSQAANMLKDRDIARAIASLVGVGVPVANEFQILNHWR